MKSGNPPSPHQVSPLRVRYSETDRMGIVYHANYLSYCEIGRTDLLENAGFTYRELEESGIFLVVRDAHCRFHGSTTYDDSLIIQTWIRRLGRAGVDFEYRIEHQVENRLVLTACTTLACLDAKRQLCRFPERLHRALSRWVVKDFSVSTPSP